MSTIPRCRWSALSAVFLAAACTDSPTLPVPLRTGHRAALSAGTVPEGNRHFRFLSPLPTSNAPSGTFDATLSPVVTVRQDANVVAEFTTAGQGSERVRVDADDEQYVVNWKTPRTAGTYRVSVNVGSHLLGYVDVTLAASGRSTSIAAGSTLPIKFRIDQGALDVALAPIGPGGGSLESVDGTARLQIPAGALDSEEPITAEPAGEAPDPDGRLIAGTATEFGPDGLQFSEPVQLTLAYDQGAIPGGVSERLLRLYTFVNGGWELVAGSDVDPATNTVTGSVTHFSTYAVLPAAFVQVTAGEFHACGLTEAGSAWCWGANNFNQLGGPAAEQCANGSTIWLCATQAVEVQGGHTFTSVEAGTGHSCGLTSAGEIWCWGDNAWGQLGDGTQNASASPVRVSSTAQFTTVSAEATETCGLTASGEVWCWGLNNNRQLGSATGQCTFGTVSRLCSPLPVQVAIPAASAVDVGLAHACALTTSGSVYCWGWNAFGQIGNGTSSNTVFAPPTQVAGSGYTAISAGAVHSCAISAGIASCWGSNFNTGALGDGLTTNHFAPAPVAGGLSFASIDASNGNYIFTHSCGVTTTGTAVCWGANRDGALGVTAAPQTCTLGGFPPYDCAKTPIAVETPLSFGTVTTGRGFSCGRATSGDVYCWGLNDFGNLGIGTTVDSRTPVKVKTI